MIKEYKITKQDLRNYLKARDKIGLFQGKKLTPAQEIYMHEARNDIGQLEVVRDMIRNRIATKEDFQEEVESRLPNIIYASYLHPITEIKKFDKKSLSTKTPTRLYDQLRQQQEVASTTYNNRINLTGENAEIFFNEYAISTALFTNIKDALKWSPQGETINVNCANVNDKVKITIENKVGDNPREGIGLNQGIGGKYTTKLLKAIGGQMKTGLFEDNGEKYFKKELIFPTN